MGESISINLGQIVSESMSTMVDGVLRGTQSMQELFKNAFKNILLAFSKDFIDQFFLSKIKDFDIPLTKNFDDLFGQF